jgi:hypothetical protein
MRRRGPLCFYAFDLLWLDGSDLRDRPLIERERLLRKLLLRRTKSVMYVDHFASGTDLFRVICDWDMEGCEAGKRQVHARSHDLGQDQEPAVHPGGLTRGFFPSFEDQDKLAPPRSLFRACQSARRTDSATGADIKTQLCRRYLRNSTCVCKYPSTCARDNTPSKWWLETTGS